MSQVPKARPECQGMSQTSPWPPRAARVFVCILRCAFGGGARCVRCVLWGQRQHSRASCCFLFSFCFSRMWIPISRGVSDLSISVMASFTQILSSSLRFFCACSSGDMTTPTAIVWRTVFKKPENCLQFSMEHVSFSFNARATEFSSPRRIWFLTAISLLSLFVLVFLSSFFIQCIWTVFQRCASRSAYIVFAIYFLKSPGIPQFFG